MCVSGVRPPPRFFQPPLRFLLSASVDSSNDLCRAPRAPPNRNPVGPQKAEDRDRRVAESPASRQAIGWLPTRLHLGDAVRRKPWSPAASLPSVGTPKRRGSAVLPNCLPPVRLGLLSSRLQLGDAVRRWSPASLPNGSEHRIHCARPT